MRNKPEALSALMSAIMQLPDVVSVDGRFLTGSVIVRHQAADFETLRQTAEEAGVFVVKQAAEVRGQDPVQGLFNFGKLPIAAMLFLGIYQVTRGSLLPPALTLAWYATELIRQADNKSSDHTDNSDGD